MWFLQSGDLSSSSISMFGTPFVTPELDLRLVGLLSWFSRMKSSYFWISWLALF